MRRLTQAFSVNDPTDAAAAEFNDKDLADLTYAIGLMNAFNRFGIAFRSTPAAAAKV